jgi:hypothetical protein
MSKTLLTACLLGFATLAVAAGGKVQETNQNLINQLPGAVSEQVWRCVDDGGQVILTVVVNQTDVKVQGQCEFASE